MPHRTMSQADLVAQFEHAAQAASQETNAAAREEAERALSAARHSADALQLGQIVLSRAAHPQAQFHAALLMRDALLQSWQAFSADQIQQARTWLLQHIAMHAARYVSVSLHAQLVLSMASTAITRPSASATRTTRPTLRTTACHRLCKAPCCLR